VTAWETGVQEPSGQNLLRLQEVLDVRPGYFSASEEELGVQGGGRGLEQWLGDGGSWADALVSRPGAIRLLGDIAPAGEAADLKQDQLEVIRRVAELQGVEIGSWWYELLGRVRAGDL
jgi:hypothetical protein